MKETCESLFGDFLYQCWPWPTTVSTGTCGHRARGGGRCETCLAADLLERYGLDVTTPQWSRDENGRIVTNWHPSRPPKMEDDE